MEPDLSSGAHHPPPWLSAPAEDVMEEKREARDVGESRGEVAEEWDEDGLK